jgi:hypothetical protein
MNLQSAYINLSRSLLLLIPGIFLLIVTCTRDEDPEEVRKESLARELTGDIRADSLQSYISWMEGMGTRFALADNHRDVAISILKKV